MPVHLTFDLIAAASVLDTANLWLSAGIGRSILGALAGGIIAVEAFKSLNGVSGSTQHHIYIWLDLGPL